MKSSATSSEVGTKIKKPSRKRLEEGTSSHYRDPRYYNHAYRSRRSDVAFYQRLAMEVAPNGPVLELGVGSGRIACALAKKGIQVTGIDRMSTMLQACRDRLDRIGKKEKRDLGALVKLHEANFLDFNLERSFPLIIAPFNALMHVYTWRDLLQCLQRVQAHLKHGGRFVFDVLMPDLDFLKQDPDTPYRMDPMPYPGKAGKYWYTEYFSYDEINQIQWITIEFINTEDPDDRWTQKIAHRYFFPQELEALLNSSGFLIEKVAGNYAGKPLKKGSDIMLVSCVSKP